MTKTSKCAFCGEPVPAGRRKYCCDEHMTLANKGAWKGNGATREDQRIYEEWLASDNSAMRAKAERIAETFCTVVEVKPSIPVGGGGISEINTVKLRRPRGTRFYEVR